jgi:hypothetical protein
MPMTDWKESKRIHDEARRVERDAAELSQRVGIPNPLTAWKRDADARAKARRQADRERRQEERRDRRERSESVGVAELRAEIEALRGLIQQGDAEVINTVSEVISSLPFEAIANKLGELERLLNRLREMSAAERGQPIDLPSMRFRSSRHNAN